MISYIIVDDEPIAHRIIEGYCDNLPHLKKIANCFNAFEAMQLLNEQSIEIMFLDINMPKLSGFDFLKTLSNPPQIIVTTAYQEFALEGYELNIADYLLKPFSFERLVKAVNKAIVKPPSTTNIVQSDREINKRFFIKGDKRYHQINQEEILYVEAYGNYVKVYLENEMIISHDQISNFENQLPIDSFLRVHRSFIVHLNKINLIEGNLIHIGQHKIPVGQTYKSGVNKLYQH